VGDEDLERADDLGERDGLVGLPVLCRLYIIDEDDEVLVLALVVDLGLLSFASGHDCDMKCRVRGSVWFGLKGFGFCLRYLKIEKAVFGFCVRIGEVEGRGWSFVALRGGATFEPPCT